MPRRVHGPMSALRTSPVDETRHSMRMASSDRTTRIPSMSVHCTRLVLPSNERHVSPSSLSVTVAVASVAPIVQLLRRSASPSRQTSNTSPSPANSESKPRRPRRPQARPKPVLHSRVPTVAAVGPAERRGSNRVRLRAPDGTSERDGLDPVCWRTVRVRLVRRKHLVGTRMGSQLPNRERSLLTGSRSMASEGLARARLGHPSIVLGQSVTLACAGRDARQSSARERKPGQPWAFTMNSAAYVRYDRSSVFSGSGRAIWSAAASMWRSQRSRWSGVTAYGAWRILSRGCPRVSE